MNLSPLPVQKFFDNNGRPLVGGLLFTYEAGTTDKIVTYKDSTGLSLNTNPIVLDFRGEANVWLDQTLSYKFVLARENDTDPPTNPIWTVDNISAPITYASLTRQIVGSILWPRTQDEINGSVTPSFYYYSPAPWLDVRRFGATGDGVTDDTAAIQRAIAALPPGGGSIYFPQGTYVTDSIVMPTTSSLAIHGITFVGFGCRATILRPLLTNKPVFIGQPATTPTLATAPNRIRNMGFQPHTGGSTGACIDMKNMSYTIVSDIEFIDNGAGRFAYGILLDTTGPAHCYENIIDGVRVNNQPLGPVTLIRGIGTPNLHKVQHVSCVGLMPMDGIVVDTTALMWSIEFLHWEGLLGTAIKPCDYLTVRDSYFENCTAAIDATGRTTMNVQCERLYLNSAPLLGGANTNYSFINCFDSASTIPTYRWLGGDFAGPTFRFKSGGGLNLDGSATAVQLRGVTLTVANNGTAQFTPWNVQGNSLASIVNDNAQAAIYQTRGGGNATVEISDPQAVYTTVSGTAGSTNIYWSGSRYEIQNLTGAQRIYTISFTAF